MNAVLSFRKQISQDIYYLEFALPESLGFRAGQFFPLTVLNPPESDNRGNKRYFGFVNSPSRDKIASLIFRSGTSTYKKWLTAAPLGTVMDIGTPEGDMTLPDDTSRPLVFITADVGISPYVSVLRHVQESSLPYHITLVNLPPVILGDDLASYAGLNPSFKLLTPQNLDILFLRDQFSPPGNFLFYVSGIPRFVTNTVRILHDFGLPPTQMKLEIFTGY